MTSHSIATDRLSVALARILRQPLLWIAVGLWAGATGLAWWLAGGFLPFDIPAQAKVPFATRMTMPSLGLIEVFLLMIVVFLLTRRRHIPDMAARAPGHAIARRETIALIAYAMLGQAGGWALGPALGFRPFSFHIAGTLVGCTTPPSAAEIQLWAAYNFVTFAVLPYLWFRRRYSAEQLNLTSTNRGNDLRVILVIGIIESAVEFAALNADFFKLTPHQMVIGGAATFFYYFVGTVLPTMVLIYAILLPRYLKLTGSVVATVLLGGVTYAAMHLVEGWSSFTTPRYATLSILFVFFQYMGPGMIKSVLTLRTGNAWVHALGYHAFAPHMIIDTPMFVKVLGIR